ncbi:Domain of unknown function DUF4371 [Cinara cedri]|uniref:DUF4371 domain-containing protein n=1 Tax=Cinara cedri TaxID=506608 RepID=A0A5E4NR76_9HEMI|nr:Domain of unknown function DUF4371 [Cinara cedri]
MTGAPNRKKKKSHHGARRLVGENDRAVKGNRSILSFPVSDSGQEPFSEYNCSEEEDNPPTLPTLDPYLFIDTVSAPRIIRTLVEIGPCQPGFNNDDYVFAENMSGKQFSSNWYNKDVKSGTSWKGNWLVYSPKANEMFCFPRFLIRSVSRHSYQWSNPNKGVSNFRKGYEKVVKHEKCKDHREVENEYLILKSTILKDITIQQNLIKVQKSQIEFNQTKHLTDPNRNETYLSPKIQTDILKCMADKTLHTILNEVKQVKYFTIIVDSTIDIGRTDQFSFSLRFVDQPGDIKEHFLCFEELHNTTANDYFDIIKKLMEEYKLDISLCRRQAYDGANTTSGRFSGLQSKIKKYITISAIYSLLCSLFKFGAYRF